MAGTEIDLNGAALTTDPTGALLWAERSTMIVADLHLEKGSAFAANGTLLPPYDTAATLGRLAALVERNRPAQVICLGDSFHDGSAAERLSARDGETLARLVGDTDWIWVVGNHDPAPPTRWGGCVVEEISIGPLAFRHEARKDAMGGEVSGHYHPRAAVHVRGRRLSGRCFVTDGRRVVLPAFGAYAGGLDVRDPALRRLLARRFEVHLLGRGRVVRLPADAIA